jgi:hypothetical protein
MFVLLVATITVLSVFAAIGIATLVVLSLGGSKKRKARRHALLGDGLSRLKTVVSALLERVNDLDQQILYASNRQGSDASRARIAVVANDLVKVSDTISTIDQLIAADRFDDAADLLSASCRLIDKVVRIVTQLESGLRLPDAKSDSSGTIDLTRSVQAQSPQTKRDSVPNKRAE